MRVDGAAAGDGRGRERGRYWIHVARTRARLGLMLLLPLRSRGCMSTLTWRQSACTQRHLPLRRRRRGGHHRQKAHGSAGQQWAEAQSASDHSKDTHDAASQQTSRSIGTRGHRWAVRACSASRVVCTRPNITVTRSLWLQSRPRFSSGTAFPGQLRSSTSSLMPPVHCVAVAAALP